MDIIWKDIVSTGFLFQPHDVEVSNLSTYLWLAISPQWVHPLPMKSELHQPTEGILLAKTCKLPDQNRDVTWCNQLYEDASNISNDKLPVAWVAWELKQDMGSKTGPGGLDWPSPKCPTPPVYGPKYV